MSEVHNQIIALVKSFRTHTHGHHAYLIRADKEYFSYIILDEEQYTRVDGETDGDCVNSTTILTEQQMVAAVKNHVAHQLSVSYRGDFPSDARPFTNEIDLIYYFRRLRALYDASSSPEYTTKFWWANTDHTALVANGTVTDVVSWAKSCFAVELAPTQTEWNFLFKDKDLHLQCNTNVRSGFLQVHLKFAGAPIEMLWSSSIGLARSLFKHTGKAAISKPCMMSQEDNHWYQISANGEWLVE